MAMRKVGFVGLGVMGGPMAGHVLRAGFNLSIHDANCESTRTLQDVGAKPVELDVIAAECDDVILCLPGDVASVFQYQ